MPYEWIKNISTGSHHTIIGGVKVTRMEGGGYYWAEHLAGGPWDDRRGTGHSIKGALASLAEAGEG